MDLGSGGGLPGLPLAVAFGKTEWALLEGGTTRAAFLADAVVTLGIAERVQIVAERAEVAGRTALRGTFDLVVARSFGRPAVTAECAAPFLKTGGRLVVAEPPEHDSGRWPVDGVARLGLVLGERADSPPALQILVQVDPCPDTFPRRNGVPSKRPLF